MEVYVNDMLVKSLDEEKHLDGLQETFDTLRWYNMKLNPSKCAFGVSSGKFLGLMVSYRGIVTNPDKIQAIEYGATKEYQRRSADSLKLNSSRYLSIAWNKWRSANLLKLNSSQ